MSRFEGGHRLTRFPWRFRFLCVQSLLPLVTALLFWALAACAFAQDVNVHIEPRDKPATPPAPSKSTEATANPAPAAGSAPSAPAGMSFRTRTIRKDVDLVLVNVTVTDDWNRIVTGLEKENFTVMEGNEIQEVRHFTSEDAPISLGVIFDMSGSMAEKIT